MNTVIKIIIADDHKLFRKSLIRVLNDKNNIQIVAEVSDGKELQEVLKTIKADIILMDVKMPGINGIDSTKLIKSVYPEIKVLGLSWYDDDENVYQMIKAGADGFLQKSNIIPEINTAITNVKSGKTYFKGKYLDFAITLSKVLIVSLLGGFMIYGINNIVVNFQSILFVIAN